MEEETLQEYLEVCQAHFRQIEKDSRRLHVVLGNESADLDSVVSSLVYSLLLSKEDRFADCVVLPIINTPSNTIHLRTEVVAVLRKFGISESSLIYIDQVNLADLRETRLLSISLVDHNVLSPEQIQLKGNVTDIIDHHQDEDKFKDAEITKLIHMVGSCCTLIAEKIINYHGDYLKVLPIAELLLCTILGDTQNLSSSAGRGTEYDIEVCEELQEYVTISGDELYQFVVAAKFDITGLSSIDVLRKDFKFVSVKSNPTLGGISSITMETDKFFARDDAVRNIMTYCTVQKLDFMILMFIWTSGSNTKRELVLFTVSDNLRSSLSLCLTAKTDLELKLSDTLNDLEDNCRKYFLPYEQGNVKASRKVVAPIITEFLEMSGKEGGQSLLQQATGEEDEVFTLQNSTPDSDIVHDANAPTSEPVVFKDEENIRKVEKEIELFENEKKNVSLRTREARNAAKIRTQSEIEFERLLYGSTSSEVTESAETDTECGTPKRSESFIRKLINDAYAADEAELKMNFDGEWDQESGLKRSSVGNGNDAKALIYIKDLSFDFEENTEIAHGSDVFAPVFLAVTEEDEGEEEDEDLTSPTRDAKEAGSSMKLGLKNMRKKAQSIENLCVVLGSSDTDIPNLRSRSKSDLPFKYRRKPNGRKKKVSKQRSYDDNFNTEFRSEETEAWKPLGRKFYSQDGLDEKELDERPMVRFADDQSLRDSEYEGALFPEARLEIQEDEDQPAERTRRTLNTASMRKMHKSVERLFFEEEGERPVPDGSSDETYESRVTYTVPDSPHVRGLWNRYIAVNVGIQQRIIDLELVEPYMKVISHGGCCYTGDKRKTVMVFTACYLPSRGTKKYDIIMEQLFYYVIHTLDLLVEDEYILVYFNSGIDTNSMPKRSWLRECYYMIDRRLKKSLSALYFVHPNFWLRALVKFYRPFISGKFYKKIKLITTLTELEKNISTEYIFIPEEVRRADPEFLYWSRRL